MASAALSAEKPKTTRFGMTSYQWGKDWDIPTMIENCRKAKVFGVELRTKEIPHEQTIAQVAKALNEIGAFASGYGQQVRTSA